ncbi:MAG: AAA family ATPase [Ferruginibacter sp.]
MIKKIVILGPESTGKSTLCEQLAIHYKTLWVNEYARKYLLQNGMQYSFDDLLIMAKGQLALEDTLVSSAAAIFSPTVGEIYHDEIASSTNPSSSTPVFIDTDMNVLKVWSEFVFDQCDHWILNQIVTRKYDLYLLCDIDLPWVKDELREYPDLTTREKLFHHYKDIMVNQEVPWAIIKGNYDERFINAREAVQRIL